MSTDAIGRRFRPVLTLIDFLAEYIDLRAISQDSLSHIWDHIQTISGEADLAVKVKAVVHLAQDIAKVTKSPADDQVASQLAEFTDGPLFHWLIDFIDSKRSEVEFAEMPPMPVGLAPGFNPLPIIQIAMLLWELYQRIAED